MKLYVLLLSLVFACAATAHEDHVLAEGIAHELYHLTFWLVLLVVACKGLSYLLHKIKQTRRG